MTKTLKKDELMIKIFENRELLGKSAAEDGIKKLEILTKNNSEVNVIFAAAPSQVEFLRNLAESNNIIWTKVNAFHLDEYIGLEEDSDELFSKFLEDNIFSKVEFKNVYTMNFSNRDIDDEIKRYSTIIDEHPIDIAFIGVGENGHIAFNDPPVADFTDEKTVKKVTLDNKCRQQQVNDGCFDNIMDVPKEAATVTIPTIMKSKNIYCMVPGKTKSKAIGDMINGPITTNCPASILRKHNNCTLYLDIDSSSELQRKIL